MKKLLIIIILISICASAFAYRMQRPRHFTFPMTEADVADLNSILEELFLMQQGRYELDSVTSEKSNANDGEVWLNDTTNQIQYMADGSVYTVLSDPLIGDATYWEDLRFPAQTLAPGATAADPCVVIGSLRTLCFDGGATAESANLVVQWPHAMKQNSTVYPHVHWGPSNTGAGFVIWGLEYSCQNTGGTFVVSATSTVSEAAGGVAHKNKYTEFPPIDTTAYGGLSGMCLMRVFRDPTASGDTYGSDAELYEFDIHYQLDSIGSRDEEVK
jgi:hypothetical protein